MGQELWRLKYYNIEIENSQLQEEWHVLFRGELQAGFWWGVLRKELTLKT
jgi:hypothetical protein